MGLLRERCVVHPLSDLEARAEISDRGGQVAKVRACQSAIVSNEERLPTVGAPGEDSQAA